MPTAVSSSFDVAFWFIGKADAEGVTLPTMKLQRLMFLSQAYFAASTRGERLMPSVFVSSEQGPIEPNMVRLAGLASQNIETLELHAPVRGFLDGIWDTFGLQSLDKLDALVMANQAVREAMGEGRNTEISATAMHNHFSADLRHSRVLDRLREPGASGTKSKSKPKVEIPKFHRGKPVKKWLPGMKPG
ncbi:MAG: hypothetical protein QF827_08970 [Alphaproteobacteria bacterium]|nr:hypothetical protein [Alphaproteobacteria bacterium]